MFRFKCYPVYFQNPFQPDDALPHYNVVVQMILDETLTNSEIGREGTTHWSCQTKDLTSLDFFLAKYVKDKVYLAI